MGRLLLVALLIVTAVLLWKAFGPGTWNRPGLPGRRSEPPAIKGPDDDPDFLWNIDKQRFKERRAREEADRAEEERRKRERRARPDD
ncbi:hypothetical protein H7347_05820 [Corynebacterium sp. zg-331]|uniref:hypothetical protein n=1 Tax=unclassified Corynebacterium TaxID=2624378 RepID=UPI0013FFC8B9|nr:hypothetical protein [Corynebacterium sp. zg-331]MPV52583.1 hypothetical protein [Corynebacterium sp. zg331]